MKRIRNSFRTKLIAFLLFAITIPILISMIVTYQYTKFSVKEAYITNNSKILFQGSQNIAHYLSQVNQASLMVYHDTRGLESFHQIISESDINFGTDQHLYVNLQYMANSIPDFSQAFLYFTRSDTSHRFAYNIKRMTNGLSYPDLIPEDALHYLESTHLSHTYNIDKFPFEKTEPVISLHKRILNYPSDEILGTLTLDIRLTTLKQMSNVLYNHDAEQLFILDEHGNSIFNSHPIDQISLREWYSEIKTQESTTKYLEHEDDKFNGIHLFETVDSPIAKWTIIKRIPYDYLFSDARHLTFINSLIGIICLIIVMIAVLYISYYFTTPIKRMLKYINQVEIGKIESVLDVERTDEIGILSRRFHQLIQHLNNSINNEYKLVLANRTNQLKALQAQINPHFLNNALQSIGTLALQNNQKKIYELIMSLGKMMRYQINTNELPVKLSTELEYVKNYLHLQSQRFEEKLKYTFEIDENTRHIEIPPMLLQPIVENSFKHGFVKHNNHGEILIKTYIEDRKLYIEIADNGVGMDSEKLYTLQQQLLKVNMLDPISNYTSESIGLFNTQARLQLHYQKKATLSLSSIKPHGLKITMTILLESEATIDEVTNRR